MGALLSPGMLIFKKLAGIKKTLAFVPSTYMYIHVHTCACVRFPGEDERSHIRAICKFRLDLDGEISRDYHDLLRHRDFNCESTICAILQT